MRAAFICLSALALAAAPAGAATRNYGITGFTKIRVDGPFRVTLGTGVAPFAQASGSPAALDRVKIDVRGDTLVVQNNPSAWGGYPGTDPGPVDISVGTHELSSAVMNGSGLLTIDRVRGLSFSLAVQGAGGAEIGDAGADQMNVNLVGTASARLAGQTAKLTGSARGLSRLDAGALQVRDASIAAEGPATIDVHATNSLTVEAAGPATIRVQGKPSCSLRTSGSTSVTGCR